MPGRPEVFGSDCIIKNPVSIVLKFVPGSALEIVSLPVVVLVMVVVVDYRCMTSATWYMGTSLPCKAISFFLDPLLPLLLVTAPPGCCSPLLLG